MRKRLVSIALGALSVPALGLGAYAAAHAVSDTPAPQVVIPAGFHPAAAVDDRIGHDVPGADDPVGHDANDNRLPGSTTTTVPRSAPVTTATTEVHHDAVDNDGPDHDAVDNDGPIHDADENHRGKASTTTSSSVTATTAQVGRGRGGPGPGGGGGDDGSGHH